MNIDTLMKIFGLYRVREIKVKCPQCDTKFIVEAKHDDDIDEFELCPECNLAKQGWEDEDCTE